MKLKQKFRVSSLFIYLLTNIFTFLCPILLGLFFSLVSSHKMGLLFEEVLKMNIFGQIMQSVLSLLILVLFAYIFYKPTYIACEGIGWKRILSAAATICLIIVIILFCVSVLFAADIYVPFLLNWYKFAVAMELLGASAGIVVCCMIHPEVYFI